LQAGATGLPSRPAVHRAARRLATGGNRLKQESMSEAETDANGAMDSTSIQVRAYTMLKAMLDEGRLQAGERLLEAQVAKAFGISRSPARHALQKLCEGALIRELPGRGYEVVRPAAATARPVTDPMRARRAVLEPMKIVSVPHWERMYGQLEKELCSRMIFSSVRIVEERVAEQFGVSRTVVRDVLARMHSVGLVTKDSLGRWIAPQVTPAKTHHLYELRWMLEPTALQQAAPSLPPALLERARATVIDALDGFPREGFDTDVVENDLHVGVLSYCPNDEILQSLARTRVLFVPTRYLYDPVLRIPLSLIEDALKEHQQIYGLLLDQRADDAATALQSHLKNADERWLKRFESSAGHKQEALPPYLAAP